MKKAQILFCLPAVLLTAPVLAFNSGSSGADGPFKPTTNTERQLPSDGVLNFTDVDIPAGVTVTFKKNAANTPVYILASGDINIAGTIDVSGASTSNGGPGEGGPGGFSGGKAALLFADAGSGHGPGGGDGGFYTGAYWCYGSGGGYASAGGSGNCPYQGSGWLPGGGTYGSPNLVPFIGGSGGGGTAGFNYATGANGAGGGGALLLAANGTITVTGSVLSNGGYGNVAGGGSGGAIRMIASTISGNGAINVRGGGAWPGSSNGGNGRIRLEAETMLFQTRTNPDYTFSSPREVFPAALPTIRFVSVAGVPAPAQPTGDMDISLPANVSNPVTVEMASSGIPVGSTVKLLTAPEAGQQASATATISGSEDSGQATAQINIADGKSTLIATASFTITAAMGEKYAPYTDGEQVARIELTAGMQGASTTKLITASGKEYLLLATAQTVYTR